MNNGFGDSKIFNTNILVKLMMMMMTCLHDDLVFHPLGNILDTEKTQHDLSFSCVVVDCSAQLKLALLYLNEAS